MNTGKLDRRITLITPSLLEEDAFGGFIATGQDVERETWCQINQLSVKELISYGMDRNDFAYKLLFHFKTASEVGVNTKFRFEGKLLHTASYNILDDRKKLVEVIANGRR